MLAKLFITVIASWPQISGLFFIDSNSVPIDEMQEAFRSFSYWVFDGVFCKILIRPGMNLW